MFARRAVRLFRPPRFQRANFTVLAIESSADDTCAAIVDSSRRVLSNVVIGQLDLHEKFRGIEPMTAIHAHQKNMPVAVSRALAEAKVDIVRDVDGIAFTRGPGLPGCLSVGMNAAKTLAAALGKPLIGVHHMQGHALTPLLTSSEEDMPQFPFLTLLVSGGHTLLLLAESNTSFKVLVDTADLAIGRAIDRVSTLLAIPWTPLGPGDALEKFAEGVPDEARLVLGNPDRVKPGPKDFSFAGLHSQVERYIHAKGGLEQLNEDDRRVLAYSFQHAAFSQLEDKIHNALNWCQSQGIGIRHLVVSGGVASNQCLRQRLSACLKSSSIGPQVKVVFPPPRLCTDNAVMIAWASMSRFASGDYDDYRIGSRPRWTIEELNVPSS